ncbi:ATP synthase subunit gamma [Spirochaetota bacterium]|nr:ATP synthase subunit gamma [Spirochaetota bacterium]
MATLKELNTKITSLKQTKKITSAMKLIATTRFNKMLTVMQKSRAYVAALNDLYSYIKASDEPLTSVQHAATKEKTQAVQFVVFTSDRGLCGSFNSAVIKTFEETLLSYKEQECHVDFIGNRGYEYFKNSPHISKARLLGDFTKKVSFVELLPYANEYLRQFNEGSRTRLIGVYNEFVSTISQKPRVHCLLPFEVEPQSPNTHNNALNDAHHKNDDTKPTDHKQTKPKMIGPMIFEPDVKTLVTHYVQEMIRFNLYQFLIQSVTGEHAARMTAMDNATRNCDDLIDSLTLERNRVRQAAITTELTEIISGAEAAATA